MKLTFVWALASCLASCVAALATPPVGENFVGGYVLFGDPNKLQLLAKSAATLPVNRIWLSFVRPDMYYVPGSNNLVGAGLNYNNTQADYGFAEIKQYVQQLQAGGVEVFISMGGWDYNCWPWAYAQYSIFNYGSTTPTFQSTIQQYAQGSIAGCNESNQFCYACEPPANGNTPDSFAVFPEPGNSPTWKQAQAYVTSNNQMGQAPVWHSELIGGASFTTPKNGVVTVPGSNAWSTMGRDPYQDLVYLAKDLGLDGVDIDYEEFWHADMFKVDASPLQNCGNGCTLFQTVFKYSAILEDVRINIQNVYPSLKLSTAASAAGAWAGTWWGGNLKGITLNMVPSYPDLVSFVGTGANAGGWNVMSYDLSNSAVNCPPAPAPCSLDGQVQFYMSQYAAAGVQANVGYEIGTPAFPPPSDASHQMPLSNSLAGAILSNTQPYYKGGFFWELFKPQGTNADVNVSLLAQALCQKVLGANTPRCAGSIPVLNDAVLPGSSNTLPVGSSPATPPPAGPPACAAPFNPATQYLSGNTVSYKGYNYIVAYYPALGTLPSTPSSGWTQQGLCLAPVASTSAVAPVPTTAPVSTAGAAPLTTATSVVAPVTTAPAAKSSITTPAQTSVAATTTAKVVPVTTTAASSAPAVTFAPYLDTTANDGFDPVAYHALTGTNRYTLGFVTADANGNPQFAGNSATSSYYQSTIAAIRAFGGDVTISFGGSAGTELALVAKSASALAATYMSVINNYNVNWADFDVEGAAISNTASVDMRNQAIALMQAQMPNLKISYTLPTSSSGLVSTGLYVISSATKYKARVDVVNIMAMDYFESSLAYVDANGNSLMGKYAISAAQATYNQVGSQVGSIGVCPMIGINDDKAEVFQLSDATQLAQWVNTVNYVSFVAFWVAGADNAGNSDGKGAASGAYAKAIIAGLGSGSVVVPTKATSTAAVPVQTTTAVASTTKAAISTIAPAASATIAPTAVVQSTSAAIAPSSTPSAPPAPDGSDLSSYGWTPGYSTHYGPFPQALGSSEVGYLPNDIGVGCSSGVPGGDPHWNAILAQGTYAPPSNSPTTVWPKVATVAVSQKYWAGNYTATYKAPICWQQLWIRNKYNTTQHITAYVVDFCPTSGCTWGADELGFNVDMYGGASWESLGFTAINSKMEVEIVWPDWLRPNYTLPAPPTTPFTVATADIPPTIFATGGPTITVGPVIPVGATCFAAYVSTQGYNAASQVSFNGINYVNTWYEAVGYAPGPNTSPTDGGWIAQSSCPTTGSPVSSKVATTAAAATTVAAPATTAAAPVTSAAIPTTATTPAVIATTTSLAKTSVSTSAIVSTAATVPTSASTKATSAAIASATSVVVTSASTNATSAAAVSTSTASSTAAPVTTAASTTVAPVTTAASTTVAPVTTAAPTTSNAASTTVAAVTTAPIAATSAAVAQTTAAVSATNCFTPFVSGTVYNGGAQVSFNGVNYNAKWWQSGSSTPDQPGDGGWNSQGACGAIAAVVVPGSGPVVAAPANSCNAAWDATKNYVGQSSVSYKGFNYVNSWWENPGADPATNGDGGWVKKGACGPVGGVASATSAVVPVASTFAAALTAIVTAPVIPPAAAATSPVAQVSTTLAAAVPTAIATSLVVPPTVVAPKSSIVSSTAANVVAATSPALPVPVPQPEITASAVQVVTSAVVPAKTTLAVVATTAASVVPPTSTGPLANARAYAASLSTDPILQMLKGQARTNFNIDSIYPGNPSNPDNVKRVESIVTPTKWNVTYFSMADPAYTYTNFLKSVGFFAGFCDTYAGRDSDTICKRLLSTMFAHFAQETGAHSRLVPIAEWQQSLVYVREMTCTETNSSPGCNYNNDCTNPAFNTVFPCAPGPNNGFLQYFGRGAHQLSYSFNYGPFSEVIYGNPTVLLNTPSLVADTWLNLASAIFFFLYPQPPKPSMLGVMDGTWVPNAADIAAGRSNDFPSTIQIINGECAGSSLSSAASNRISYYKSFAADMGLDTSKENFNCANMPAFDSSSSAAKTNMYWVGSYLTTGECQLVPYQTNFNALMDGPNYDQYVKCVDLTYNTKLV
ncbi:hypothetical protein HDU98_000219 [Podochytrium sp. JEL0797]|nr:hypothetical protein HDU98_000219 [Podochytrium sp. JEL0797]